MANPTEPIGPVRPRLLIVTLSLDVGGTEKHISLIAPELKRRGFDVSIFCIGSPGVTAERVRQSGVDVVAAEPSATSNPGRIRQTVRAMTGLARLIGRSRPSIVHFFLPGPYLLGAPVAILRRVPIRVMSRRGINNHQGKLPGIRLAEMTLHQRMTAVLGNSRRVVADLLGEGCARDRIGLIYNGTDLAAFATPVDRARVRSALEVPAGALLLVKIANLIPYKGHSDLLKAMALAAPRLARPLVVALAGRDDGIGQALRNEARSLGVQDQVRFLGLRTDVPDILKAADIGSLVSHEEGFSNAVIESMAAGLPMLVTDVGGNAEAVVDGVCGLVVPPHAPDRLAEALIRLAGDDALRARMGAVGRDRAERHYALTACVDRYEALYLGLAAGRLPGAIPGVGID